MQIEWIDWNKIAMEKAKKVKAYICTDKRSCMYYTVVFAETRGKAKSVAQTTEDLYNTPFIHIAAKRIPQLDDAYRFHPVMNWKNDFDRVRLVRDAGFVCDAAREECNKCSAFEWCTRGKDNGSH